MIRKGMPSPNRKAIPAISTVLGDTGRGEPYALSIVRELLSVMTIVMAFSSRLLSR